VRAAGADVAARQVRVSYAESVVSRGGLDAVIGEQGYEVPGNA
jgi:hypothetical protein